MSDHRVSTRVAGQPGVKGDPAWRASACSLGSRCSWGSPRSASLSSPRELQVPPRRRSSTAMTPGQVRSVRRCWTPTQATQSHSPCHRLARLSHLSHFGQPEGGGQVPIRRTTIGDASSARRDPPFPRKGEIVSVVWHNWSHRVELNYVEGDPDYLEGDERVISLMAEDEGLWRVPTRDNTRRWVRP